MQNAQLPSFPFQPSVPTSNDVLCGHAMSGQGSNPQLGNRQLDQLIEQNIENFQHLSTVQKRQLCKQMLACMHRNGSRMLEQNEKTREWYEIGDDTAVLVIFLKFLNLRTPQKEEIVMPNAHMLAQDTTTMSPTGTEPFYLDPGHSRAQNPMQHPEDNSPHRHTSVLAQDPHGTTTAVGELMNQIHSRVELDREIARCQTIVQRAGTSEDVALLEQAVAAEERLPLLTQLLQLEKYRSLAELEAELEKVRQTLAQATGMKERLFLARKIASLEQRCKQERLSQQRCKKDLFGAVRNSEARPYDAASLMNEPIDSSGIALNPCSQDSSWHNQEELMLKAGYETDKSKRSLEQYLNIPHQNDEPLEAQATLGNSHPKRRKISSSNSTDVIDLLDDSDSDGGDEANSARAAFADRKTTSASSATFHVKPPETVGKAARAAHHLSNKEDAPPRHTKNRLEDWEKPLLL